mmetsp:Transcript_17783/g.18528  ORF Transcript_17783/g.18528 Transcript_17783/m.18528 type:complete len:213 (+) Transcript_17783:14-652(+)
MRFRFCGDLDCPDWVLLEISTLSKLTSVRMKILVVQILSYCIEGTFNYEKVIKIAKDNADGISDLKGAIAAVHFIISNSAKHDLDELSLVQEIQQLGLPKEHSEAIARQYREHKDTLRLRFSEESYRVTSLLASDWRVDLTIASSESTKRSASIQLKLELDTQPHLGRIDVNHPIVDGTRVKELAFELTTDKLDVLLHELLHAQSLMETVEN